jgi:hypothetical protein
MVNIKDIQAGDLFNELSYFSVVKTNPTSVTFKHLATGTEVDLGNDYVSNLLSSADSYVSEETVGIEDKLWTQKQLTDAGNTTNQVGDVRVLGMKSIWDSIGSKVFRVSFIKKGKELSKTAYTKAIKARLDDATSILEKAKTSKKGVTTVAIELMEDLIHNPIISAIPGEERILRGWKLQHESLDGQYAVMDSDLMEKRVVNLNTIQWIILDGVKYIKE